MNTFKLQDGTSITVKTVGADFMVSRTCHGFGSTRLEAFRAWRAKEEELARKDEARRAAHEHAIKTDPAYAALHEAELRTARLISEGYAADRRAKEEAQRWYDGKVAELAARGYAVVHEGALPKYGCRRVLDHYDVDSGERFYAWLHADGQRVEKLDGYDMYIVKAAS